MIDWVVIVVRFFSSLLMSLSGLLMLFGGGLCIGLGVGLDDGMMNRSIW